MKAIILVNEKPVSNTLYHVVNAVRKAEKLRKQCKNARIMVVMTE